MSFGRAIEGNADPTQTGRFDSSPYLDRFFLFDEGLRNSPKSNGDAFGRAGGGVSEPRPLLLELRLFLF